MNFKMKTILYIVRHGQSKHNVLRLVQGGKNPRENTLSEKGKEQARELSQLLAKVEFDVCYSSPIYRALETSEILTKGKGLKIIEEQQLREKNQGRFVGSSVDKHIEAYKNWNELSEDERLDYKLVPDEESQRELRNRAMNVLKKIADENMNKTILVVTHGGFMRSVFTFLEKRNFKERWRFDNCGFMKIEFSSNTFKILDTFKLKEISKEEFAGTKNEEK